MFECVGQTIVSVIRRRCCGTGSDKDVERAEWFGCGNDKATEAGDGRMEEGGGGFEPWGLAVCADVILQIYWCFGNLQKVVTFEP